MIEGLEEFTPVARAQTAQHGRGALLVTSEPDSNRLQHMYIRLSTLERDPLPGFEGDIEFLDLVRTYDISRTFIVILAMPDDDRVMGSATYYLVEYPNRGAKPALTG